MKRSINTFLTVNHKTILTLSVAFAFIVGGVMSLQTSAQSRRGISPKIKQIPADTIILAPSVTVPLNPGFEAGIFSPWVTVNNSPVPLISSVQAHSGTHSAFVGSSGSETPGDSSFIQFMNVPTGISSLSYWYLPSTIDSITFDWQDVYVTDGSGVTLATVMHVCTTNPVWTNVTFDMTPFAGTAVGIKFLVHGDGAGDPTNMYVDDVSLAGPSAAGVSVSGRVMTPDGRGLRNAIVVMTDPSGAAKTAITSAFGYYRLDEVTVGSTYVVGVKSKLYTFSSQIVSVSDNLADLDFVGQAR